MKCWWHPSRWSMGLSSYSTKWIMPNIHWMSSLHFQPLACLDHSMHQVYLHCNNSYFNLKCKQNCPIHRWYQELFSMNFQHLEPNFMGQLNPIHINCNKSIFLFCLRHPSWLDISLEEECCYWNNYHILGNPLPNQHMSKHRFLQIPKIQVSLHKYLLLNPNIIRILALLSEHNRPELSFLREKLQDQLKLSCLDV